MKKMCLIGQLFICSLLFISLQTAHLFAQTEENEDYEIYKIQLAVCEIHAFLHYFDPLYELEMGAVYSEPTKDYTKDRAVLGDFRSRTVAENVLAKVHAKGFKDAFVIKHIVENPEYIIRLGTFKKVDYARFAHLKNYEKLLLEPVEDMHRVCLGVFLDKQTAQKALEDVQKQGFPEAFLQEYEPKSQMVIQQIDRLPQIMTSKKSDLQPTKESPVQPSESYKKSSAVTTVAAPTTTTKPITTASNTTNLSNLETPSFKSKALSSLGTPVPLPPPKPSNFFEAVDELLQKYVANGRVNYGKMYNHPEQLDDVLILMKKTKLSGKSSTYKQAFYINAYNMCVIKTIIDHYPMRSPMDIQGFFDAMKYQVAGELLTLEQIEKQRLFGLKKDARFHFALVCGAKGCPPLKNTAYQVSTLDAELDTQTRKALNNPTFIQVDSSADKAVFSEIFKWYASHFTDSGNPLTFINQYRDIEIPSNYTVDYYPYNWDLNGY